MTKKKILVNAYYAKNLGDDLFLKILFDRYPQAEFYLLTADKDYLKIFQKYKNVNIIKTMNLMLGNRSVDIFSKINMNFLKFKKFDAFLNIGGSIFMESPNWKRGLVDRDLMPNIFKKNNKKIFILGANFGPFKDDFFIERHKQFFRKFDDICFRDSLSHNLFKELPNVRFAPDIVFNLDIKQYQVREKCVGFSIIDLEKRKGLNRHFNSYNQKIIQLMEEYINLGYKIKLFSFCEKEGDLKIIKHIRNLMNEKYKNDIKIIEYDKDIDYFLNQFNTCETIVGTRFHSIILALVLGQSFFPLIYSDKTYNILEDLKMEKHGCYIKDISKVKVSEVTSASLVNRLSSNNLILNASSQFEKLDEFIC
ncbi:polysaccharide pyruvyl transferase family protein [Mesobacillus subterraneus]|uniref:polysaccharide pyruvyl transferase family protein n=1 Tax=Mesobacillus subterraneus TaxID=285983 RepID=UPI0020408692|nr:polysaccharide pyruvyl transferase family protein [Mesobacillus subterraneus]MCM3665241.1 polysaccharide pyruvyl transferase family protein [Mesobacillus subterraneus]MCM3684254.1 polysaccharide pyruvyl transferase family protein [Mesobacillus subterraneus]